MLDNKGLASLGSYSDNSFQAGGGYTKKKIQEPEYQWGKNL